MNTNTQLKTGLGLRPKYYDEILSILPKVSWFEAISENYMPFESEEFGKPLWTLEKIRAHYPIVLHGVSLSIGSTDPVNQSYLNNLKKLIYRIQPEWVSDHLCWTGVDGINMHDLMPLPYTEEVLQLLSEKLDQVQTGIARPIILENVSSYITYANSEMNEWEFLNALIKKTGCQLLLDINNIYVSSVNHQFDPITYLNAIPAGAVKQFHLAGYSDMGTHLIDTHDHAVYDPVWSLYKDALKRFGPLPTLIEWDAKLPEFSVLLAEYSKAEKIKNEIFSS